MKGLGEFIGFLGLSVAAHLAVWQGAPDGGAPGGVGGAASVSLKGAAPSLQTLVEEWDRPIETVPTPVLMPPPDADGVSATTPAPETAPVPLEQTARLAAPDASTQLPEVPLAAAIPRPAPPDIAPMPALMALPIEEQSLPTPEREASPLAPVPMMRPAAPGAVAALPEIDRTTPPAPPSELAPKHSPRPPQRQAKPEAKPQPKPKTTAKSKAPDKPAAKPAPKAAKPAQAAPKKQVAGIGGTSNAGKAGKPKSKAKKSATSAKQMARWGGAIRSRVERRKRFPGGATGRGQVRLWMKVSTNGRLASVGVAKSSGNPAFDKAAISAVRRASLPRAPKGIAPGTHRFTMSMTFSR